MWFILPLWISFGIVATEAFSAGRAVIVFNSGALPEQVNHGVNGFMVKIIDSKSLAEALQKFTNTNKGELLIERSKRIRPVKTMREYVDGIGRIYFDCIKYNK